MPTTQTVPNCNSSFTITVQNQDGYWPKSIFFDRNGNGTGTDYNTVEAENMPIGSPWPNNTYPSYYRKVLDCGFSGTSTDESVVTDKIVYTDKADYLTSNGTQMTTMNYTVESEYKCCFYLMVDLYEATQYDENLGAQTIRGDCATILKDSFYIAWDQTPFPYNMVIGKHIPLLPTYFVYDSSSGLINNTSSTDGFVDEYDGITTVGFYNSNEHNHGLENIVLQPVCDTIPEIPYITYTVSRYKKLPDYYKDIQVVTIAYESTNAVYKTTISSINAANRLSPCFDYDVETDTTSTPNRPWLSPTNTGDYYLTSKTLNIGGLSTQTFNFLNSGTNVARIGSQGTNYYYIVMHVTPRTLTYTNLINSLSKAVTTTSGDSHISIGDIFYDARDGQIKQRVRVIPPTPDKLYDNNHVFFDSDTTPNIINILDCDDEGNEHIRCILPNDPDIIGVQTSLSVNNHGMYKFVNGSSAVYTFFNTLRICADGYVTWYRFSGGQPIIDGEWHDENNDTYQVPGMAYDSQTSGDYDITLWSKSSGGVTYYYETWFPAYYGSSPESITNLYAYSDYEVNISSDSGTQITEYTYNATTGVATITVGGVNYTLESDDIDYQIEYYERQTEYVNYEGTPYTGNDLNPSTSTDSEVNKTYCLDEGESYVLYAMGNYGGHVVGWETAEGETLSSDASVNTAYACCKAITPIVQYGYDRPFYYYVIKGNELTQANGNPVPPINTYGLKKCASSGSIYTFVRKVDMYLYGYKYVPRKMAIFGDGSNPNATPDYNADDAVQSVYIALMKISDSYLKHDAEGNIISLPDDLSCADIIYGGDGLSEYINNGYVSDGSAYIFVYARPDVTINGNQASYVVKYGASPNITTQTITYNLISLSDDDSYIGADHDLYYRNYLKAPLFNIEIGGSGYSGVFEYNDELIASFDNAISAADDNHGYVFPNSYLNTTAFINQDDCSYRAIDYTNYFSGILYYEIRSKASQVLHLNSYFFSKQYKVTFTRYTYSGTSVLTAEPFSYHYTFYELDGGSTTTVTKYADNNINKLTKWLPQGSCIMAFLGDTEKTFYGRLNNTIMFYEAAPEDLGNLVISLPCYTTGNTLVVFDFLFDSISSTIAAVLTSTSSTVQLEDKNNKVLTATLTNDPVAPILSNLTYNGSSIYGTIYVRQRDDIYNEDYYQNTIAGYTFSNIQNGSSVYSPITVYDQTLTKHVTSSVVNGWNVIHTVEMPYDITGTDGCTPGDEELVAKVWPNTLYTDSEYYAENVRIKLFRYEPTTTTWDSTSEDNVEQNVFLTFTVKSSSGGSTDNPNGSYRVTLKFYDIISYYFTRGTAEATDLPTYLRVNTIDIDHENVPYYVANTIWSIYDNSDVNYMINTVNSINDELLSYIDFDEETYEVVLKHIFGNIKVETSWQYGVYNHILTTSDSSRHTIYHYALNTPVVLKTTIYQNSELTPGYAGYPYSPYGYLNGVEDNRTLAEIAQRYELSSSNNYSATLPNNLFNVPSDDVLLFYSGYSSTNQLHIPECSAIEDETGVISGTLHFGNATATDGDTNNANAVILAQSARYIKEGYTSNVFSCIPYALDNHIYTQYTFNVYGNGGGRYLHIANVARQNYRVLFRIGDFGNVLFLITNGNVNSVICDFRDYLNFYMHNDITKYQSALNTIANLKLLAYLNTHHMFEIGPLPYDVDVKTIMCRWEDSDGTQYYYDTTTGTQNFITIYEFIDTMTTVSSGLLLSFHTVQSDANHVFKYVNNFDSTILSPYGDLTVEYTATT